VTEPSGRVVRIERTVAASAEDVFDAWTSPEVTRRWFHCGPDWGTPRAEVDLRVGGNVRVVMRRPDGTEAEARGEYTLIDRPHRLVMTWSFDDDPSNEQLVELTFSESEELTTVLMVNSGISTDQRREDQDWGWPKISAPAACPTTIIAIDWTRLSPSCGPIAPTTQEVGMTFAPNQIQNCCQAVESRSPSGIGSIPCWSTDKALSSSATSLSPTDAKLTSRNASADYREAGPRRRACLGQHLRTYA
jgi:uncharacterized protein YndB with AHSA1/START domain